MISRAGSLEAQCSLHFLVHVLTGIVVLPRRSMVACMCATCHVCRAMVCYLACLKEFGAFAAREEVSHGRPPFEFPFVLDGDKARVGGCRRRRW